MRRAGRSDAVHKRLEMEVARLEGATPAEVLGVPQDTGRVLVREVGERMSQRYVAIAESDRYSAETRELASQLVTKVEQAVSRWGYDQRRAEGDPTTQREQVMYEQGMVLVDASDFARADRVLTKARDLAMANPGILAALGWARFNNPDREIEERQEEGKDYLLLAEQFNSRDPQAAWFLCQAFRMLGDDEAALHRARRVVALEPTHRDAKLAVKELSPPDDPAKA